MGPVVDVRFEHGGLPAINNALTIPIGERTLTVEVLAVAEAVRKDDASAMYREV